MSHKTLGVILFKLMAGLDFEEAMCSLPVLKFLSQGIECQVSQCDQVILHIL